MLDVREIHHDHDGHPLLQGAALQASPGQTTFLLGPSGSGKTTLLRIIAGLDTPRQGAVVLDGMDLDGVPTHRRRIGMMFQEPALFPHLNVLRNVAFGIKHRPKPPKDMEAEAGRFLALVGLADRADAAVDELSGGERQRVSLARTLAAKPRAVLLDEPLSALDADLRMRLGHDIKALLQEQDVPVLWVTHDQHEAERLADRALRLQAGRIVEDDPAPPAAL